MTLRPETRGGPGSSLSTGVLPARPQRHAEAVTGCWSLQGPPAPRTSPHIQLSVLFLKNGSQMVQALDPRNLDAPSCP